MAKKIPLKPKAATRPARPPRPFPIVGIGASAGGLEAVTRLLTKTAPDTGMGFVVVQHLDPTRESLLAGILQRATTMPVAQAVDGVVVRPNTVHIIPPNAHMRLEGDKLRLIPRPEGALALSVNCFLFSLAEQRGNRAIAVILSGTASDGTLGVKAIKAEGGLVFAQDENSAGHFGMPESAAATGVVDFVMPPEKIAAELATIAKHPALDIEEDTFGDPKTLAAIFLLLRRSTGVDFGLYKPSTIKRRMLRRLMLHKLADLGEYLTLVEKDPDEVRALHDDLLIHVTHFFREPRGIAALRAKAFPRILKSLGPDAPVRVWVPGCSSGEEAYTIAIALFDFLSERDSMNPVQIFATDLSDAALDRARTGVYSPEITHHVSPRLLRRFFSKTDRGYEIVKRVRDACVFARQDLTKDPPFANVDLISCCNVLIYLGPEVQKQILPMFHYALRPAGALMLGNSETVGAFSDLFAPADKKCRLYWKKPAPSNRPRYDLRPARPHALHESATPKPRDAASSAWPETDVQKVADRLLLARFAPAGVVVNGDLNVLHFRGRVGRYLEPVTGRADLSLLKMMPAHAAGQMKELIRRAKKADAPVVAAGIELGDEDDGRARNVAVEAVPFRLPLSGERFYIVLFHGPAEKAPRPDRGEAAPAQPDASVKRLKIELASTRGYLQTIVEEHEAANEELKSSNEEIISSNEELQSTNEELEIAKEELQAANEELSTVNEELQTRSADLTLLNNDLQNLISSVHLPIVMVSSDLRIRRFTPMAEKVMNLIPGDIGRPIGDLQPKISLPNIEEILHEVIETVTNKSLEVRDREGRAYAVSVRPYKTVSNQIEGAVIVFTDSGPVTRAAGGVLEVSAFEAVLEMTSEPLALLDEKFRVVAGSRSLYQTLGLTPSPAGRPLFELEGGRWNTPLLRASLEALIRHDKPFSKLADRVGGVGMLFSARGVKTSVEGPSLVLLSITPA